MKKALILAVFLVFTAFAAHAADEIKPAFRTTDLPLPRFVSLRSDQVYARAGPGPQFPVKWEYRQKGLPVEIVLEYDHWRKIRDIAGDEGWVHKSLLTSERSAIIRAEENVPVRRKPGSEQRLVAWIEPQATAALETCEEGWCRLSSGGYKGWVERRFIWGVYETESF